MSSLPHRPQLACRSAALGWVEIRERPHDGSTWEPERRHTTIGGPGAAAITWSGDRRGADCAMPCMSCRHLDTLAANSRRPRLDASKAVMRSQSPEHEGSEPVRRRPCPPVGARSSFRRRASSASLSRFPPSPTRRAGHAAVTLRHKRYLIDSEFGSGISGLPPAWDRSPTRAHHVT
jgi:hypothetical protein